MKKYAELQEQINDGRKASEILHAARTTGRRKRELSTLARQLCIKEEFLEALENGEYHKIPEHIYVFGFARNYAVELELDPRVIVQKIKLELGVADEEVEDDEPETEKPAVTPRVSASSRISKIYEKTKGYVALRKKKIIIGLGALAVLIALIFGTVAVVRAVRTDTAEVQVEYNDPNFAIAPNGMYGTANRGTATVVLQANAKTWLKISDSNGETLFSKFLARGDVYFAPKNANATIGNAGGLDIYVNGRMIAPLGENDVKLEGVALNPNAL
ncbi:MAG: helix-turn-helix domain-containing protein [Rickettsiales bacterium]|jgi:cytoskeletal protein RodZ|nr:helix-turn-helix domain-containing protein [Rickettsiales bacterium]